LDVLKGEFATQSIAPMTLLAGFVAAFVVGCLACRWMIEMVKRGKLIWFALYCAVVGAIAVISYWI
jgi:undecaprenyl-diphosphatase